jgi:hypothetical protein
MVTIYHRYQITYPLFNKDLPTTATINTFLIDILRGRKISWQMILRIAD